MTEQQQRRVERQIERSWAGGIGLADTAQAVMNNVGVVIEREDIRRRFVDLCERATVRS